MKLYIYDLLFLNTMTCFITIQDYDLMMSARYGNLEKTKQALHKGANFKHRFYVRSC